MKHWIRTIAAVAALAMAPSIAGAQDYPAKPVKVIVPTNAGGSVDAVARIIQRYVDDSGSFGEKLAVVNMDGAGGTIGTRAVHDAEPDGYTIGLWHEGLITSAVMGVTEYDHTDFTILGITGYSEIGLGTGVDNKIKSFQELLDTAKAAPDTVLVATNVGLAVHFVPLMMQEKAGIKLHYVQVGGGAKRFPSVVGGHTDVAIFAVSEFIQWKDAGLRPLVIFSEERMPELPDVPTAKEFGIDLVANGMRIWIAPKGIPDDAKAKLSAMLKAAVESEAGKQAFVDAGFRPVFIGPEETVKILDEWDANARPLVETAKQLSK
ncbi:MAG: tripartite tricarboxylate transporter substrate binding protein [Rhodobiaceae bacterium]|nr:tripartite tricarboxylate transporter substrate binding protein [Rhodobiaceae bacterium]